MKRKKLFSMAVAGMLVATQMVMPAMAGTGTMTVPVTTKSAIIRVDLPTSMNIAVNQFAISDAGSQIYSGDFTMSNKSDADVKVVVKSTATVKSTTKLLASKADVAASTKAGEVWLAAVARTAANSYADGGTEFANLNEASKNVATFVQGSDVTKATAKQTFYLKAGTAAFKLLNAGEATKAQYTEYYELTEYALTGSTDADKLANLQAKQLTTDIYTTPNSGAVAGAVLTKQAKGDQIAALVGGTAVYYTAKETKATTIENTKCYVYADAAAVNGSAAAFRYIGKLSDAQDTWEGGNGKDISQVVIVYDITGYGKYDSLGSGLVYGHVNSVAPSIATTEYDVDTSGSADTEITVVLGSGDKGAKGIKSVMWGAENFINEDNDATFDSTANKLVIDKTVGKYLNDNNKLPAKLKVIFDMNDSEATPVEVEITLKKN